MRRLRKVVTNGGLSGTIANGTTDYIYNSQWQCIEERDENDSPTKQYVWGNYIDELIQQKHLVTINGHVAGDYYPLQDLLYRTMALTEKLKGTFYFFIKVECPLFAASEGEQYMLNSPYPRPRRLTSDQYAAMTAAESEEFLNRPDNAFTWEDYVDLFAIVPGGRYEELVYFIPHVVEYTFKCPDGGFQIVKGVIGWIAQFHNELRHDHLLDEVLQQLNRGFMSLTEHFRARCLTQEELEHRGFKRSPAIVIDYQDLIMTILDAADEQHPVLDLARLLNTGLIAGSQGWIGAAWLLERQLQLASGNSPIRDSNQPIRSLHAKTLERVALCGLPNDIAPLFERRWSVL